MTLSIHAKPACWSWPLPHMMFGSPAEAYGFMKWWNRACAVCGEEGCRLYEDHDHDTMLVRGWLCNGCNVGEGQSRLRGGVVADVFARYRERCPAMMLGIKVRYGTDSHRLALALAEAAASEMPTVPPGEMREAVEAHITASIRTARKKAGLSQQQAANLLRAKGFRHHQQTIWRMENGQQVPSASECKALAEVYGTTIGALVGERRLDDLADTPAA